MLSTAVEQLNWVLDELAFPGAMTAVRGSRRGTGSEKREARTRCVGDSERRAREIDRSTRNGGEVRRQTVASCCSCVDRMRGEGESGGVGVEVKEREREVVDGDDGVRSRAFNLKGRVATAR